jgi:hypothetical protein
VESDFFMLKLVANSGSMNGEDLRGGETLYKYLIRQTSQPASVVQIHYKKSPVALGCDF